MKLSLLLSVLMLAFPSFADDSTSSKIIKISAGEWPPFIGKNLDNFGSVGKTITDVFALQGYTVEFEFYPWTRAYVKAQEGEFDATAVWMFDESRTEHFYYSDPVAKEEFVFFYNKENPFSWSSLEDLTGKELGGGIGYSYGEPLNKLIDSKQVSMSRVKEPSQNILRLKHQRIDLYPEERQIGMYNLSQQPKEVQDSITYHPKPFLSNDSFLLFSKQSPNGQALLEIFNQGLKQWNASQVSD
ncbi:transporter substrate-binding domain-containing protein [Vibrio sp. YMD68]|uniref:substrate-binding periplasmic protein n=1 Tax=Vibrio sp. YMD68 TaxID=3042300 RepID=UPI00249C8564|nr:transporter substrate-binding domain-containing protein [Vibrio sp. YMD68]WGW00733.1 transporter substrate-binding domain-containing protein [Vibrio sp. YMD68]